MASKSNDLRNMLEATGLLKLEEKMTELGIEEPADMEYLQSEDWDSLGLTKIEQNKLKSYLSARKGGPTSSEEEIPVLPKVAPNEGVISYLIYKTLDPKQGQVKLNLEETFFDGLVSAITTQEQLADGTTVELYAPQGYPLACDSFAYNKSLRYWQLEHGSLVLAIPRKNLMMSETGMSALDPNTGASQIFVKHNKTSVIRVDIGKDTGKTLRQKLFSKLNIPTSCIKLSYGGALIRSSDATLSTYNVQENSTVQMWTYGVTWNTSWRNNFTNKACLPLVDQAEEAMTCFNSTLYCVAMKMCKGKQEDIAKVLGHIRRLVRCPALIDSLNKLFRNEALTFPHKVAIQEILFLLFKQLLNSTIGLPSDVSIEDKEVFASSPTLWAYLISAAKSTDKESEEFREFDLLCSISNLRVEDPVVIPGCNQAFDRESILEKIEANEPIHGCTIDNLTEEHLHTDTMRKKLLLSFTSTDYASVWQGKCTVVGLTKDFEIPKISCSWSELVNKRKSLKYVEVLKPLELKSSSSITYVLTLNSSKSVVVYVEREACAATSRDYVLFNPQLGDTESIDPDELASSLYGTARQILAASGGGDSDAKIDLSTVRLQDPVITRRPEEAIIVLIDISGSMSTQWDSGVSRLNAVKQLFHAFANRTMAYNLFHVVGLTVFARQFSCVSKVTELFEQFKEYVDALYTKDTTALYDSINDGITQLIEFTTCHPNICSDASEDSEEVLAGASPEGAGEGLLSRLFRFGSTSKSTTKAKVPSSSGATKSSAAGAAPIRRRIICLTDGDDNASKNRPLEVVNRCLREEVVVDSFIIGQGNERMKAISHATGGCSFLPTDIASALKLFEMEGVLSLSRRTIQPARCPMQEAQLSQLESGSYDHEPETQLPPELTKKVISAKACLAKQASSTPTIQTVRAAKRIMAELAKLQKEPHASIEMYPSEDDISFWRLLVSGPEFTPYENCVFLLYVKFPEAYPLTPPEVRFVTPIYHCNINQSGRICHSVFGRNYSSDLSMREILDCMYGLLLEPEPNDPLDSNMAEQYFSERETYNEKAKRLAEQHAKKSLADWRKELLGAVVTDSEIGQIPKEFICPLCGDMFTDPVKTPFGDTYERMAIENHLDAHETDPKTGQPLKKDQLVEDVDVKERIRVHQEANVVPKGWWDK